jgi:hypothetical protein
VLLQTNQREFAFIGFYTTYTTSETILVMLMQLVYNIMLAGNLDEDSDDEIILPM